HDVARRRRETTAQSCSFAAINRMINDAVHHCRDRLLEDRLCSIFGAIVNENNLLAFNRRSANGLDDFFDGTLLIVTRNDDGNFHFFEATRHFPASLAYANSIMEESNPQAFARDHCNLIATARNPSSGLATKRHSGPAITTRSHVRLTVNH